MAELKSLQIYFIEMNEYGTNTPMIRLTGKINNIHIYISITGILHLKIQ